MDTAGAAVTEVDRARRAETRKEEHSILRSGLESLWCTTERAESGTYIPEDKVRTWLCMLVERSNVHA